MNELDLGLAPRVLRLTAFLNCISLFFYYSKSNYWCVCTCLFSWVVDED